MKNQLELITICSVFLLASCSDDILSNETEFQNIASISASHYAAFPCELENNVIGAECKISQKEMCTEQFDCQVPIDDDGVSNFTNVLYTNYTDEERESMMGQPIEQDDLIDALVMDGFPIDQ